MLTLQALKESLTQKIEDKPKFWRFNAGMKVRALLTAL